MKIVGNGGSDEVEVWPDNWAIKQVFGAMTSQLNVSMGRTIGLRYESLPVVLDLYGIAQGDRLEIFDGLRVMEGAVVKKLNGR